MHKTFKRLMALIMCLGLILTNSYSGGSIIDVYALGDGEDAAGGGNSSCVVMMNGVDISVSGDSIGTDAPVIYYGDDIEFTIETQDTKIHELAFFIIPNNISGKPQGMDDSWTQFGHGGATKWDIKPADDISGYYVGFFYSKNDGDNVEDFEGNFGFRIEKGTFADPTEPVWDGTTARWGSVAKTVSGGDAAEGSVSYAFKLYKQGSSTPIIDTTVNENSYDLSQNQDINRYGNYYFTVQAVPSAEASDLYNSSGEVSSSDRIIEDVTAPVIKSYTGDSGVLTAVVNDAEAGVKYYSFSTESSIENITDWETFDEAAVDTDTELTYELTGSDHGAFFLHVKDADGNGTTSGTGLNVTHIQYQNFYDSDNGLYSKDAYIIGSVALETPVRPGYQFDGWLRDETPVTAADITAGSEVTLTAKWTRSSYSIETQPQSVSAEYDGQERILTAAVGDDVVGNVNWTWYKTGAGEAGADLAIAGGEGKDTSLNVKNVSDSGTYYAVATVTLNDGEESRVDIISEEATVDITRKALTITAENIDNLVFGDSAPAEYAYSYEGLVDGEEAVLNGAFTSAYTSDSPAGTYDITEDPDNRFEADNYAITIITGTLTVLTKEAGSSVEVALADENDAVVEYNGNFYEPAVTVRDNGKDIDPENYTVIYSDNQNAGTATVTVEFKKNYSGEKKISFEITKARAEAVVVFEETGDDGTNLVTSWIYGTAASYSATQNGVQIKTNTTSDSTDITYHYLDSENNDITAGGIPKAAGTYKVYVEIPETGNYLATATEPVVFTIVKRPLDIMITGGYTCAFDGEEHRFTEGNYKLVNGTSFAPGEEFSDVEILGSITDVGTVPGEFTYTALHGMDVDNNYIISIIPDNENNGDKIIITPQQLDKVSGLKWSKEVNEIGTAEWNGVSRGDMVSTYTVKLYRKAENPEEDELVSTVKADTVSHDFADVIRNDIAAMNAGSDNKKAYDYYFTVSVGAKENGNYAESELASGRDTAVMHTALLYNDEQEGIKEISMGENSDGYIILLQGETVNVSVKTEDGYTNPYTWSDVDALTVNKPNAVSTSVTLGDSISASYDRIVLSSRAEDEAPVIEVFTGETSADGQKVYIGFTASDSRNLSKWMISAGSTEPGANDPAWTDIASSDITSDGESGRVKLLYDKTRTDVTSQGEKTYYAYIMDFAGNITRSEPLHIYVISFSKGNADSTCTGTMNSIFKVEDVPVTLPELKYVYPGYSFVDWKTSATTYMDQAVYADNASDTLTAVWTDRLYKYKVEYYLQDINGEYPATATRSNTFNTAYGTTVGPETNMILLHDEGFTLDSSNLESKLIDADNIVVKLYYTRNKYNLKYILTMPDDTVDEKVTQVYYGAPVTEREKTEIAGYTFIGWKYSDAGTRPATMPAHDVTATAYYKAGAGAYRINYYIQDVDDNKSTIYNLYSSETIESEQGSIIDASIDNVSDIEGFTCVGRHSVYDNNPVAGYVTVSSEDMAAYADERDPSVSAVTTLNINYYFDRNVYTLTFDLWNNEERTQKVYTNSWQVKYGTPINPADYINDNAEKWDELARDVGVDTENYRVTEVSSWSTGLVAPATMPVGDVTVFRQYIPNLRDKFRVKLYLQLADGTYPEDPDKSIVYEGTLNEEVHVGSGTEYDVNADEFEYYIPYYQYAYSVDEELSDMSGTVVDTSENDMLELKLYLKRTVITAKINYIYKDINGTETTFATIERSGLWSEISNTGNKFSYDPFLYFYGDSSAASEEMTAGLISGRTVNGVSPIEYDFNRTIKNDAEYVCSVSVSEVCNYRWDTKTYSNVTRNESGDFGTPKGYGRTNNDCRVNVYYTEIDVTKSFYFDFEMNKSVDNKYLTGEAKTVPITYTYGERTYKLREANLSDLAGTDFSYGEEDPYYYAANDLKRGSSVTGEVKDGFQKVEIGGRDYYITTNADDNGDYYIYIPNPANSYYPGHYCSASYSTDVQKDIPFVTEWLDSYKTRNADESLDGRDTMAAALYVNNRSSTVINSVGSDGSVPNRKVTVNFAYGDIYNLNMNLLQTSGQTINAQARYVKGSNISYKNIMDNIAAQNFTERSGYEIKWYLDSAFTEPLMLEEGESSSKAVFSNIAGDKYIYGRYEKERLIHHLYIYYMTSDSSMPYVTIDDVSDDQGVKEGYTKTSETKQVVFQDEEGKDVQITVKNDTYSKDGNVVLKDMQVPGVAYTELILTDEDIEKFLKEGFYYDESNPDNKTYAYCEHSPVKFHIYYARNKHNLKIDNKYDKDNVVSSYIKRYGYTVEVQDPEKPGYIFKNWDVKKIVETDDGEGNITETHEDLGYDVTISDPDDSGIRTFEMPDDNIILEAVWEETAFDTTMKHFFQTEDQSYMTMLAGDIAGVTGTPVTVDGYGSAQKYTVNGTDIIGVLTSFSGKEYRLYFTTDNAEVTGGAYKLDPSDLVMAENKVTVFSNDTLKVNDYVVPTDADFSMFDFYIMNFIDIDGTTVSMDGVTKTGESDQTQFKAKFGMDLDYYYTRKADLKVETAAFSTDGSETGLTLSGDGTYVYGNDVTVSAVLDKGYRFKGWYNAEDVLVGFDPASGKSLSEYELDLAGLDSVSPVELKTEASPYEFDIRLTGSKAYVAVSVPDGVVTPVVTITGKNEYTYGYSNSSDNKLTAEVKFDEEVDEDSFAVKSYQWYLLDEKTGKYELIPDAVSGIYNFETGKNAGEYTYKCKIVVEHVDNGRTIDVESAPYKVTVNKKDLTVSITDYSGYYDGEYHNITAAEGGLVKNDRALIYYATVELTEENYSTAGKLLTGTDPFKGVRDVNVDDADAVIPTDVYVYVVSADSQHDNYNNAAGHGTVTLQPKTVTITTSAAGDKFERLYDGTTNISGSVTEKGTDKYNIAHGDYLKISGLTVSDIASGESGKLFVDFTGTYNDKNVNKASKITLTDMYLVDGTGNKNFNYVIPKSLDIQGAILKVPVTVVWPEESETVFTYTGSPQVLHPEGVSVDLPSETVLSDEVAAEIAAFEITALGSKINVNTEGSKYTATASISIPSPYLMSNYKVENTTCPFTIVPRTVYVKPEDDRVTYDGKQHGLDSYVLYEQNQVAEYVLPAGFTAESYTYDKTYKNVGEYIITATGLVIRSGQIDESYNYDIKYLSGNLIIDKKKVTVSGIKANDKNYDGTVDATLAFTEAVIDAAADGETLVAGSDITGKFESADQGEDKTVHITYGAAPIAAGDANTDINNYVFDAANSQKTATADINGCDITINTADVTGIYGEDLSGLFGFSYGKDFKGETFVPNETDRKVTGTPAYKVIKDGETTLRDYASNLPAGTYKIAVVTTGTDDKIVSGMQCDNYTFVEGTRGTLTINPRPVAIEEVVDGSVYGYTKVSKTYDGNTDVKSSVKNTTAERYYRFAGVTGTPSGILSGDTVDINYTSAAYNSKNVSEANSITVSGITLTNPNYVLRTADGTADNDKLILHNAEISRKELTVKVTDKTITYGDATPAPTSYTINITGFVGKETKDVLDTLPTISCDYYSNVPERRNAGKYTVIPLGGEDDNYSFNYTNGNGTLTVEKAVLAVVADDKVFTYSEGTVPEWTGKVMAEGYTAAGKTYTGLKYNDTLAEVVTQNPVFTCESAAEGIYTLPGTYTIMAEIAKNQAVNYDFECIDGKLTVSKKSITVNGITIGSKVYDGTTNVISSRIITDAVIYQGAADRDLESAGLVLDATKMKYSSKDVGNREVSLSSGTKLAYSLNEYLNARYIINEADSQKVIENAEITRKPLTVKADDIPVSPALFHYGMPVPDYTATYSGFVNGESEEVLGGDIVFDCGYVAEGGASYSVVESYTITPSGYDEEIANGNYEITFKTGTLTVTANQFAKPEVLWSDTEPGVTTWNMPANIGNESVTGFELTLFKADSETGTYTQLGEKVTLDNIGAIEMTADGKYKYDYHSILDDQAGVYKVQVKAISSNEANVESSVNDLEGADITYSTLVTVQFAQDPVSQAGRGTDPNTTINSSDVSCIMVAGDSDFPYTATLKGYRDVNDDGTVDCTGYDVYFVESSDDKLTVTEGEKLGGRGAVYQGGKVSAGFDIAATSATVTVSLEARPAEAKATLSFPDHPDAESWTLTYGYSEVLRILCSVGVMVSDTEIGLNTEDYDYSFAWIIKRNRIFSDSAAVYQHESDTGEIEFPLGLSTNLNGYYVRCTITATRKDNGSSTVIETSKESYVKVERAAFTPHVVLDDWVYGESRNVPELSEAHPESTDKDYGVTYYYSDSRDGEYTEVVPKNVGTYYVKVKINETENYSEFLMPDNQATEFKITQAKLETPEGRLEKSSSAPYGGISWNAVPGPKENAGKVNDSDSFITPKYDVKLYRNDTDDTEGGVLVKEEIFDTIAGQSAMKVDDWTDAMVEEGYYYFTIQALSDNTDNCSHSDVFKSHTIDINRVVVHDRNGIFYDGYPITLNLHGEVPPSATYQWYKDGVEVAGATENTFMLKNVDESGKYSCVVTAQGESYKYSTIDVITIKRRPVTITSASGEKVYDGTALTKNTVTGGTKDYTIVFTGDSVQNTTDGHEYKRDDPIVPGDDMTIVIRGAQTEAGSSLNKYDISIKNNGNSSITSNAPVNIGNYTVTSELGTLKVTQKAVTITADSDTKVYDGTALTKDSFTNTELAEGDSIETVKVTGSQIVVGSSYNVPSDAVIVNAAGKDVTASYKITYANGTLEVTKKPVTITADRDTKVYDGTALTKDSYTNTALAAGDEFSSVTVTGSQTVAGTSDNVPSAAVIKNAAGEDVTASYEITYANGTLEVTVKTVTIKADSDTKVYDGTALTKDSFTNTALATGDSISSVTVTGSQTVVGSSDNVPSDAKIVNAAGEDVTASYSVTYANGTLEVTAKTVTITADGDTKVYDGTALTKDSYTNTALAAGDSIESVTVTGSQTVVGSSDNVPSNAKIVNAAGEDVTASYEITYVNGTLEVTAKTVTITADSDEKVYDGTALTKDSYTNTPLAVDDSIESVTVTGSQTVAGSSDNVPGEAKIVNAAGQDVTASYSITYENGTLEVTKKPVTITAGSDTKVYDGTPLTKDTVTCNDLAAGDSIMAAILTGSQTVVGSSDNEPSNAVIVNAAGEDVTASYKITYANGTLEVTAKTVTITAGSDEKVYDGTALTKSTVTSDGLAAGDSIESVTLTGSQTVVGSSDNVPSGAKIVNESGEDVTASYIITYANGTLYVTKKPVTITAESDTKVYDGTALTKDSFTNTPLAEDDSIESVKVTGSQTIVGSSDNVPSAAKIVNTAGDDVTASYEITYANGTLEVTLKTVTITANSDSKIYDGSALTNSGYTVSELGTGDSIDSITVTGSQTVVGSSDNVASEARIVNTKGDDVTSSYEITYRKGTLTVTEKTVIITADSATKVYDGKALTKNSYTSTQLSNGDRVESVTVTGSQTVAGRSDNVPSAARIVNTAGEDVTSSYIIEYVNGTLEVTQKAVTITADSGTKVYDGTALTKDSYINTALAAGDSISSVTVTGSQTIVGSSDNVPSAAKIVNTAGQDVTASYSITYANGTLEVTQKAVTITADSGTKVYDGTALTKNNYTNSALAAGDSIESVTITGSQKAAGTSSNVPSGAKIINTAGEEVTASYKITYENGTLKVTQKDVTITADSDTKVYDGTALTKSTVTSDGLAAGDSIESVTVTGSQMTAGSSANIPSAAVIRNADNENVTGSYKITYVNGTLTVTIRNITFTADDISKIYDGSPLTCMDCSDSEYLTESNRNALSITDGTGLLGKGDVLASIKYSGTVTTCDDNTEDNNVISNAVIHDKDGNDVTSSYNIAYEPGTLKILKRPVTITAVSPSYRYDGKEHSLHDYVKTGDDKPDIAATDEIDAATIRCTLKKSTADDILDTAVEAGAYENSLVKDEIRIINKETKEDVTSSYDITTVSGVLAINTGKLIVIADSDEKTYDGTALTVNTVSSRDGEFEGSTGLTDGDTITAEVTGSQAEVGQSESTVVPGTVKIMNGSVDVTVNYEIVGYETGELTVTRRNLTITAGGDEREYDGTDLKITDFEADNLVDGHAVEDITWTYEKKDSDDGNLATVGTIINKLSDAVVTDADGNDVTENYSITYVDGESVITKNDDVTISTKSDEKTYDGKGISVDGYEVEGSFADGDEIDTFEIETIPKDAGTYENRPANIVIKNVAGEDVTENYDLGFKYGTVTINKRKVTFTSQGAEKVYDGTKLTNPDVEISGEGIVEGEDVHFDVTGSQTYVGSSKNVFTYDIFESPMRLFRTDDAGSQGDFDSGIDAVIPVLAAEDEAEHEAEDNYDISVVEEDLTVTDDGVVTATKTHEGETYKLGEEIVFDINVTNIYDRVTDITITEMDGVTFENGTNVIVLKDVEPGQTVTVKAVHVITEEDISNGNGEFINTADVKFGGVDTGHTASDKAVIDEADISADLDLVIVSTSESGSDSYKAGDTITYQLTLTNDGNQTFEVAEITDTFTREDGSEVKLSDDAKQLIRSLIGKVLKPGESITISFDYQTVDADKNSKLSNTVNVTVKAGGNAASGSTDSLSMVTSAVTVNVTDDAEGIPAKVDDSAEEDAGQVNTSDETPIDGLMAAMLISAAGLIYFSRRKRRLNRQ